MERAIFNSDIADGPLSNAYWLKTDDNVRLRLSVYQAGFEAKGTILLMLGRFGYAERYGRVAKSFSNHGFTTAIIDWRSQGLSDRLTSDRNAGHIEHFDDYQKDVAAMMKAVDDLNLPQPYHLLGVSMGGCIGLRAMLNGLPVSTAAFISPMWGIKMSMIERVAAWPLSWAFQKAGLGYKYVPGESDKIYVLETPFENNNLSHNLDMYNYWIDQARRNPELQIGGPTMSWLFEALLECQRLSKAGSPKTPCITFCGEIDQLVDNNAIMNRMERWPNGKFSMVRNAKHDVLTEIPEIGGDVIDKILKFYSSVTNPSSQGSL